MSGTLKLTDGARARIQELQALSERAEEGDQEARRELRRAVHESAPEVIARCADVSRGYRRVLAHTASGRDPLIEEAIVVRAALMAGEIAGERPTPLEVLLAERVASLWVLVELLEALTSGYFYHGDGVKSPPVSYLLQMVKIQGSANRRYLMAIKTLAQVRKLQASTPGIQYNTQINVNPPPG